MLNIFSYLDYREYLEDFYKQKKAENRVFSYQLFANSAGFKSKSFIKLVIDGKKNLTPESAVKLNNVLKLNEKSFSYFNDLIAFSQCRSIQERNYHFEKLMQYNKRSVGRTMLIQQHKLYSKWYYGVIRELAAAVDFHDDFELLGKLLKPAISARKARDAVKTLLRLGLIHKHEGRYVQTDAVITTGDEVRSLAVANFHTRNCVLAANAIDTVESSARDISCLVLGLSDSGFQQIKDEISTFRKKLLTIAENEKSFSRVYHINFQAIPVSEDINAEK
jgi:uncharacterized protein (TIGR02147 family)